MSWVVTAVASTVVAVGSLGYGIDQTNKARRAAVKESDRQYYGNLKLQKELKDRQLNEQSLESAKARRNRQSRSGDTYGAKGGTVLTGPLGVPNSTMGGNKTLLGE